MPTSGDAFRVAAGLLVVLLGFSSYGEIIGWGADYDGQTDVPPGLNNAIAIAAGGNESAALSADGKVTEWGSYDTVNPPTNLSNLVAIVIGADPNGTGLRMDGTVAPWGGNDYGVSTPPPGLGNVAALAAGYAHTLALKSDGTVVAWGEDDTGQTNVPPWLSNVVALAAAEFHSLAVRQDGTVVGWGDNVYGESTGVGNLSGPPTNGVVTLNGNVLSNVVAVACGIGRYSLALRKDGTVVGWGENNFGQSTGTPTFGFFTNGVVTLGGQVLSNAVSIRAGSSFSLALRQDGTVVSWGFSVYGATNVPPGLTNVTSIAAGEEHGLAFVGGPPAAIPIICSNAMVSANRFSFSMATQRGRVYSLQYKNALTDPTWTVLPLVAGIGGTQTFTDPNATSAQRYYRVLRW